MSIRERRAGIASVFTSGWIVIAGVWMAGLAANPALAQETPSHAPESVSASVSTPANAKRGSEVVVGPEDTVTIAALDFEEINKAWRVSSSGDLNLPLLGRVQASGLTVRELETELTRRMRKYYHQPQITAFVSEFRSQPVTVTGAVTRPGVVQLAGAKSLFEVLVQAGGAAKEAGESVTVTRRVSAGPIAYPSSRRDEAGQFFVAEIPLKEALAGGTEEANLRLIPNDLVSVSEEKKARAVYITGAVVKPGAIELVTQDSVSLVRAIAMAGGLGPTAKKKGILMHVREDGMRTAIAELDLRRIMQGKVPDIELVPGDILEVPSSTMSTYLGTAASSAIMTGIWTLGRL
ncbi:MAG: polysaccharide biosynthesis/export family protein [Bryobacteraceae bacterium]